MSEDKVAYTALGSIIGGTILGYGMYRYNKHLQSQAQSQSVHGSLIRSDVPVSMIPATSSTIVKFAIGKYDKYYGDGWRQATAAELTNPAFQAALVQAHQARGGWPLLEEPLICNEGLCVAEGIVQIDGKYVVEVGHTGSQQLRGVYPAMNRRTQVAWTTTAPALGNNWTVYECDGVDYPCLFVKESASGGKKTRRRKASRKQKRGTRK